MNTKHKRPLLILFVVLTQLTLPLATFGATLRSDSAWISLFQSSFYKKNIYESERCTQNVQRFLRMARSKGFDISEIQVIELLNKGINDFGMVAAQNARTEYQDRTKRWFHHVILMINGTVLDFDYTNEPTPLEISKYFNSMFMTDRTRANKTACFEDIGRYQLTIYSGYDYLRYYDSNVSSDQLNIKQNFLKDFPWACK